VAVFFSLIIRGTESLLDRRERQKRKPKGFHNGNKRSQNFSPRLSLILKCPFSTSNVPVKWIFMTFSKSYCFDAFMVAFLYSIYAVLAFSVIRHLLTFSCYAANFWLSTSSHSPTHLLKESLLFLQIFMVSAKILFYMRIIYSTFPLCFSHQSSFYSHPSRSFVQPRASSWLRLTRIPGSSWSPRPRARKNGSVLVALSLAKGSLAAGVTSRERRIRRSWRTLLLRRKLRLRRLLKLARSWRQTFQRRTRMLEKRRRWLLGRLSARVTRSSKVWFSPNNLSHMYCRR
jgi:hypothetical protein